MGKKDNWKGESPTIFLGDSKFDISARIGVKIVGEGILSIFCINMSNLQSIVGKEGVHMMVHCWKGTVKLYLIEGKIDKHVCHVAILWSEDS